LDSTGSVEGLVETIINMIMNPSSIKGRKFFDCAIISFPKVLCYMELEYKV